MYLLVKLNDIKEVDKMYKLTDRTDRRQLSRIGLNIENITEDIDSEYS